MRMEENWAVDIGRICAFFRQQEDVREEEGRFIFASCLITLFPQAGTAMNKWQIPRTQICFEGNEDDVEDIHRRFFLRFLSAGG